MASRPISSRLRFTGNRRERSLPVIWRAEATIAFTGDSAVRASRYDPPIAINTSSSAIPPTAAAEVNETRSRAGPP